METTTEIKPNPIPANTTWIIGSIASILALLGSGFIGFYNSVCKDQINYSQAQQQALVIEVRELTKTIHENNALIKESLREGK